MDILLTITIALLLLSVLVRVYGWTTYSPAVALLLTGGGILAAAGTFLVREADVAENSCRCHRCIEERDAGKPISEQVFGRFVILCAQCRNKRCPHATDHRLACTRSNAPGQPGSVYGPSPSLRSRI